MNTINTAAYLQLMSDTYPKDINLYWLSDQVLDEMRGESLVNKDEKILIQELKRKCRL
jgi:hypothetical protein